MGTLKTMCLACMLLGITQYARGQKAAMPASDPNLVRATVGGRNVERRVTTPASRPKPSAQYAPQSDPNVAKAITAEREGGRSAIVRHVPIDANRVGTMRPGDAGDFNHPMAVYQYVNPPDGDSAELPNISNDPNVRAAYKEYLLTYLESEREKFADRREVILSTNQMGSYIFVTVHIFLAVALFVTVLELRQASIARKKHGGSDEIELSFQKIALKTSIHGTVLLVFAIVLYFLFLRIVYPITIVR